MNRSESKYFNTSVKMCEAFLSLLDKKEFEYITVKEICHTAGVNRSTFYLHYETVSDLLQESMDYINNKFNSYFKDAELDVKNIMSLPVEELYLITPQYLMPWLAFIKENKTLFRTFLKRYNTLKITVAYREIFNNVISPIMDRFGIRREDQEYNFIFYVEGIIGIVKQWVREGCERAAEDIAEIIMSCVRSHEH